MNDKTTIRFTLNGSEQSIETDPRRRLIDVLRDDFALTGVKEGCGEGECGACSVMIDDRIINSCILPVGYVADTRVETIEALKETDAGRALTEQFAKKGAVQCGFCIPGMIVAGYNLLLEGIGSDDSAEREATIRDAISGNLCRCTGYDYIVAAIDDAELETRND